MSGGMSLAQFCAKFRKYADKEDGEGLTELLNVERGHAPVDELPETDEARVQKMSMHQGGEEFGEVLSLYLLFLRARASGESVKSLELLCTCLKTWVQRYIEAEGSALWMTPLLLYLSSLAREVALALDKEKRQEGGQDAYLKKLVEIHRDLFQKLMKERTKRAGHVWVTCELLRAYFRLGQVSQCAFLLSAISQSLNKEGFDPEVLPKAISVTFYFYWGKHCVFDHNLKDADEKLTWAFNNTPVKSKANRRKILLYLVPCKLRLGVLPTQALLQEHDLGMFIDIVRAIRDGNVALFTAKMEEFSADFIKMGTYLLMMKLKFMVLRSLCKGVHAEVRRRSGDNAGTKLDLAPFEHVFNWQDNCDVDETACLLSNLIYQGAVKGYLSHEHRKLVFAKDMPFPPPSKWRM
eukprot:TRINITY_DN100837_c0_g1_i1.p1 TRINITY_DN100837_c0_g1~~TRINITY_DN100837_c0_g1_i1.p1  ORF type:complete len:408 (+),score=101.64 TRINITY_DN100837_c0_g1_i1:112-1335(+)